MSKKFLEEIKKDKYITDHKSTIEEEYSKNHEYEKECWEDLRYKNRLEFLEDVNAKVQTALCEFETLYGIRPNKIIMGHRLADRLTNQFYYKDFTIKNLGEIARKQNLDVYCKYEGIPVKIDYNNPNILEVGYMINWS